MCLPFTGKRFACAHLSPRPGMVTAVIVWVGAVSALAVAQQAETFAITRAEQIWPLPPAQKRMAHPIRIEGRVSFYDPVWKSLWLEDNGVGTYILLAERPPPMRIGQRVRLEGTLIPEKGLSADAVTVTVLQEHQPVVPLETAGRIGDLIAFSNRVVTAEGYVSAQQFVDPEHVRLSLIVDNRPVIGWVKPDDPANVPNWAGKFLRLEALYSSRFNPTHTETTIELWCGPQQNVAALGSLADSPLFDLPMTPVSAIHQIPVGKRVLVRGSVEGHEAGSSITVRDDTGQIVARSIQPERVPFGAQVEVVGVVEFDGPRWILNKALYRRTGGAAPEEPRRANAGLLDKVDQIRQLSLDEAAAGLPVRISGMVTWSMPRTDFFFLQDLSGGIRVRFNPEALETPQLGKYLQIDGVTIDGGLMPAVRLRGAKDLGSMSTPEGRLVTFEQAITGREDGQWVAMRGFIQRTESDGDWRWIYVTTPTGDFVGHLQSPVDFVANPGSLIRVHGVCEATADSTGQLTGVMLRVPFIHSITIEEDAPLDYFELPVRSIRGLRRLSGARDLTRVRISATVLHCVPGRAVYVQDGDTGLQLLTRQQQPLLPGDRIDAVGILGWEGTRIVLRETVYRRIGAGEPPAAIRLANPGQLVPALDARLVTVGGTLIDAAQQMDSLRLTIQSGPALFEATLKQTPDRLVVPPPPGSGLQLTGLYQVAYDESRQARRFSLQLRSAGDIDVVKKPRLWTVQRALVFAGILGGFAVLGIAWITALRRRVQKQTRQIREQLERQSRLEAEVHRAARLESLGVLAGGIAHDFNNLLTIIIGNLGLAMLDDRLTDSTSRCLREIERGASRARALTRQLLTFAKGGEPLRVPISLPEVVRETVDRALHGSTVRCEHSFDTGLRPVLADKDQIAQAVQNLVLNAVQAMPQGGLLAVALSNETVPENNHKALAPGPYVKLVLGDTGEGIAADVLPRIFDPYFSTRKTGSGLGLATVYSIVKRHAGTIEVESKPGEGTRFSVWLPATELAAEAAIVQPEPRAPLAPVLPPPRLVSGGSRKRVLLMDDETSIQRIVSQVLERVGLEVVAVSEGAAALREFSLAQHSGRPFDLLLLDLTVPGAMGGREAMELIRKLDAQVPAIVSSGYSNDPVMANFEAYGFQAVVQKPYDVGQLVAVVNRLLGRTTG